MLTMHATEETLSDVTRRSSNACENQGAEIRALHKVHFKVLSLPVSSLEGPLG